VAQGPCSYSNSKASNSVKILPCILCISNMPNIHMAEGPDCRVSVEDSRLMFFMPLFGCRDLCNFSIDWSLHCDSKS
jgi:hypothetical protein